MAKCSLVRIIYKKYKRIKRKINILNCFIVLFQFDIAYFIYKFDDCYLWNN